MQNRFTVKVWGCRGSHPSNPNDPLEKAQAVIMWLDNKGVFMETATILNLPALLKETGAPPYLYTNYGEHTTCLEVRCGNQVFIIDMGTGVINLGKKLVGEAMAQGRKMNLTILGTHVHLDHIEGAPFFAPFMIHQKDCEFNIDVFGGVDWWESTNSVLRSLMHPPRFPVSFKMIKKQIAGLNFETIFNRFELTKKDGFGNEIKITALAQHHPQETYGWRIEYLGRVFAFGADNEPFADYQCCPDPNLKALFQDADVGINDCQYTNNQYLGMDEAGISRRDWGHSFPEANAALIRQARVRRFFTTHHDPNHNDRKIFEIMMSLQAKVEGFGNELFKVDACHQGMEINLLE